MQGRVKNELDWLGTGVDRHPWRQHDRGWSSQCTARSARISYRDRWHHRCCADPVPFLRRRQHHEAFQMAALSPQTRPAGTGPVAGDPGRQRPPQRYAGAGRDDRGDQGSLPEERGADDGRWLREGQNP